MPQPSPPAERILLYLPVISAVAALPAIYGRGMAIASLLLLSAAAVMFAVVLAAPPLRRRGRARVAAAFAAGLMLGTFARAIYVTELSTGSAPEGAATVVGRVASGPSLYPDGDARFVLRAHRIEKSGYTAFTDASVTVSADSRIAGLRSGEQVRLHGTLRCAAHYDRTATLCSEFRITAKGGAVERLSAPGGLKRLTGIGFSALEHAMLQAFEPSRGDGKERGKAALAWALLLGDRRYLSERSYETFREAGVIHTLALSGMHLSVIAGAAALLFSLAVGRRRAVIASMLLAMVYVGIVGLRPSLLRALCMYGIFAYLLVAGRRIVPLNVLALAFLLISLGWPGYPHSLSFQLSFLSLAGMFSLSPIYVRRFLRVLPPFVAYPFAISLAALTASGPLLLVTFGEIYPVGIAASVAVGPLITLFLGYVILHTAAAAAGLALLDQPLALFGRTLYTALESIVTWAAQLPALSGSAAWAGIGIVLLSALVASAAPGRLAATVRIAPRRRMAHER